MYSLPTKQHKNCSLLSTSKSSHNKKRSLFTDNSTSNKKIRTNSFNPQFYFSDKTNISIIGQNYFVEQLPIFYFPQPLMTNCITTLTAPSTKNMLLKDIEYYLVNVPGNILFEVKDNFNFYFKILDNLQLEFDFREKITPNELKIILSKALVYYENKRYKELINKNVHLGIKHAFWIEEMEFSLKNKFVLFIKPNIKNNSKNGAVSCGCSKFVKLRMLKFELEYISQTGYKITSLKRKVSVSLVKYKKKTHRTLLPKDQHLVNSHEVGLLRDGYNKHIIQDETKKLTRIIYTRAYKGPDLLEWLKKLNKATLSSQEKETYSLLKIDILKQIFEGIKQDRKNYDIKLKNITFGGKKIHFLIKMISV